jgi:phenylacetate-coenzyme A ligase PaaK-like adenylate-forming protein
MPRRVDSLMKIKGTLVNPDVLVQAAESVLQGREFQFIVTRGEDGADALTVRVPPGAAALGEPLARAVKQAAGVTAVVELAEPHAFADPSRSWKAKRVIDLRD